MIGTIPTEAKPREWFIEICKSCGRIAQWPFCEHRDDGCALAGERWTQTVRVRQVGRAH